MISVSGPTILNFVSDSWVTKSNGSTLPLAVFHGLGDQCINPGMSALTKHLGLKLPNYVTCVEIGNGAETSWLDGFEN